MAKKLTRPSMRLQTNVQQSILNLAMRVLEQEGYTLGNIQKVEATLDKAKAEGKIDQLTIDLFHERVEAHGHDLDSWTAAALPILDSHTKH